jgi:hypothetical protein
VARTSAADDFASSLARRGAWALAGRLAPLALRGLALLAERFSAPAQFLDTIFIPSNSDLQRRGTIPERPDLAFDYDEDTGNLKLSRDGEPFYAGRNQAGFFRDEEGHVFGRYVGGNIVLDPDALPIAAMGTHEDEDSRGGAVSQTDTDRNEPKLCPKPTAENTNGRSKQAMAYQEQITQMPPGWDIKLVDPETGRPVSFDGCCTPANPYCPSTGDYLMEAKEKNFRSTCWTWTIGRFGTAGVKK